MDISNIKLVSSSDINYQTTWNDFFQDRADDGQRDEFYQIHQELVPSDEDPEDTFEAEVIKLGYPKANISCLTDISADSNLGYILLPIPDQGHEAEAITALDDLLPKYTPHKSPETDMEMANVLQEWIEHQFKLIFGQAALERLVDQTKASPAAETEYDTGVENLARILLKALTPDNGSSEQTLKLRDFIKKDIDIDIADDVCEELAIAFVGPITLTEKGEENFSEILDLPVELHEGYATLLLNDNDHWEYLLKLAIEFFEAVAGYCEQDNYDAWFKS